MYGTEEEEEEEEEEVSESVINQFRKKNLLVFLLIGLENVNWRGRKKALENCLQYLF